MTYTGVNETYVGQKPGLTKTTTMLTSGVYDTRTAKLFPQYSGWTDTEEVKDGYKVAVTIPAKWIDEPTPVKKLKETFLKTYKKKYPNAMLSQKSDDEIDVAIKDEVPQGTATQSLRYSSHRHVLPLRRPCRLPAVHAAELI